MGRGGSPSRAGQRPYQQKRTNNPPSLKLRRTGSKKPRKEQMKIKANNTPFEPCPEFTGKAVCVDVTPLRKQQSQYGERNVFKLVFEVDVDREDGSRYCVWSNN